MSTRKRAKPTTLPPQPRLPRINAVGLRDAEEKVERFFNRTANAEKTVEVYIQDMLLAHVRADTKQPRAARR